MRWYYDEEQLYNTNKAGRLDWGGLCKTKHVQGEERNSKMREILVLSTPPSSSCSSLVSWAYELASIMRGPPLY
jgi:hypothetical protein